MPRRTRIPNLRRSRTVQFISDIPEAPPAPVIEPEPVVVVEPEPVVGVEPEPVVVVEPEPAVVVEPVVVDVFTPSDDELETIVVEQPIPKLFRLHNPNRQCLSFNDGRVVFEWGMHGVVARVNGLHKGFLKTLSSEILVEVFPGMTRIQQHNTTRKYCVSIPVELKTIDSLPDGCEINEKI
jgi:hypothetical protein